MVYDKEKLVVTENVRIPGTNIMIKKGETVEFSKVDQVERPMESVSKTEVIFMYLDQRCHAQIVTVLPPDIIDFIGECSGYYLYQIATSSVWFDQFGFVAIKKNLVKNPRAVFESSGFAANRALVQKFANGFDWVLEKKAGACGVSVDHRFFRTIAGNSEYVVECIATSKNNFAEFEKKHLDPFCSGFRDVVYSFNDRQLRDGLHRIYSFTEGEFMENVNFEKTITINEECKVPGTDIVLEAGDKILFKEYMDYGSFRNVDMYLDAFARYTAHINGFTGVSYDKKKQILYIFGDNRIYYSTIYLYCNDEKKVFTGIRVVGIDTMFAKPVPYNAFQTDPKGVDKALNAASDVMYTVDKMEKDFSNMRKKPNFELWDLEYEYKKTKDPALRPQIKLLKQQQRDAVAVYNNEVLAYVKNAFANTIFRG